MPSPVHPHHRAFALLTLAILATTSACTFDAPGTDDDDASIATETTDTDTSFGNTDNANTTDTDSTTGDSTDDTDDTTTDDTDSTTGDFTTDDTDSTDTTDDGVTTTCDTDLDCLPGERCTDNRCKKDDDSSIGCACNDRFAPVCGLDGRTYANRCEAEQCAGVIIDYDGPCDNARCTTNANCDPGLSCLAGFCVPAPPCTCDTSFQPVCALDGKTYGNDCLAACAGTNPLYEGDCREGTTCGGLAGMICPTGFRCQIDDDATTTDAQGTCVRAMADERGCESDREVCGDERDNDCNTLIDDGCGNCGCPYTLAPVCGTDGITYNNACLARCTGVTISYPGACTCNTGCPENEDPVCTPEGITYDCGVREAFCNGRRGVESGACDSNTPTTCPVALCPIGQRPVSCSSNRDTFGCPKSCQCEQDDCPIPEHTACSTNRVIRGGTDNTGCALADRCISDDLCPTYPPPSASPLTPENILTCGGTQKPRLPRRDPTGCPLPDACANNECAELCDTPDPVGGTDGTTYRCGSAEATCAGVAVAYPGVCNEPCHCPATSDPVCGSDGVTYKNLCHAWCAGARDLKKGRCTQTCNCPGPTEPGYIDDPVCAVGVTFPNRCFAACAGFNAATAGACK